MTKTFRITARAAIGALGCVGAAAFVPSAAHRLGTPEISSGSRSGPPALQATESRRDACIMASERPLPWSVARVSAICVATAAVVLSSMSAGEALEVDGRSLAEQTVAPTTLVVAGEFDSSMGRADTSGLLSNLQQAGIAQDVLDAMIKVNDAVDADEDGLLEDSFAKETLVKGLLDKRRAGGEAWDGDAEAVFGILKRKLDPFNVVLLRPYLKVAPFLGGVYYLGVFFVQQKFRDLFAFAYFGAVAVLVAPAAFILLAN